MRILEILKLAQLEKGNHGMRPSWPEALEPQDTNGTLPTSKARISDAGRGGRENTERLNPFHTTWRWYTWVSEKATSGEFDDVKASTNFKPHGKSIPDSSASTTSRRGASRTGCATNAAAPSNDSEGAEYLNKSRISPKVQKGRAMKIIYIAK
ncbi:hypothetical protein E4U58_001160 [Claviceps cyperi]|nr:hypothetical protein E4U58_001160 [Claviceps cyperi]